MRQPPEPRATAGRARVSMTPGRGAAKTGAWSSRRRSGAEEFLLPLWWSFRRSHTSLPWRSIFVASVVK